MAALKAKKVNKDERALTWDDERRATSGRGRSLGCKKSVREQGMRNEDTRSKKLASGRATLRRCAPTGEFLSALKVYWALG
jgi:hypothetical protein